jgi:peptidoglycan L-alanyl-D-glutamate endopeptidase CwlK
MPYFSAKSLAELATCTDSLRSLFLNVVRLYDCRIIQGERTAEQQAKNVRAGVSKTLDSKHVVGPLRPRSHAVDAEPWPAPVLKAPVGLTSEQLRDFRAYVHAVGRFYHFAGYVQAKSEAHGVALRWGGDWDGDGDFSDQTFDDLYHFELRNG